MICIACAGVHRALGTHVSKVKSLTLDAWTPEEVRAFASLGGNLQVNRRLLPGAGPRPRAGAARAARERHIAAKYAAGVASGLSSGTEALSSPSSPSRMGTTCHQGLVVAEILEVELVAERAKELRMLGSLLLSLTVTLTLGPSTSAATPPRRGSLSAAWEPPEKRQLLWDAEERWLWCQVHDGAGDLGAEGAVAGEGRTDLLALAARGQQAGELVTVELFTPAEEDDDSDSEDAGSSAGSAADSFAAGSPSEPQEPQTSARGRYCGSAQLRLTVVDMSGMHASQERKAIS